MNKLKSKLSSTVMFCIVIISFIFTGCENSEKETFKTDIISGVPELTNGQIEYIGKMHNVFVERAFNDYFGTQKTRSTQDSSNVVVDIIDLISFFERQPESLGIHKDEINKIKKFYYDFKTDENSNYSYSEQLLKYLKSNVEAQYGIDYNDIINPTSTRSSIQNKTNAILAGVAFSVNKNSEIFWTDFHGDKLTRAPGSATIAADTGGALWGLFFGPIGSIIAGGVASIVANEIECADGDSPVFDGKIHTPKDI